MSGIALLFFSTILQNASFTLVSRARNSKSIAFHSIAAVLSNGIWLLVLRQVVNNLDSWAMMATYIMGSVVGSVGMHWLSMHHIERWFRGNK